MLSKERIEKSIAWLLNNGSAPVRYMTLLSIVDVNPSSAEMKELWREAQRHPDIIEMFTKQRTDGSWCDGGSWASKPGYIP